MLESYWADLIDPKDPLIQYRKKSWDRFEAIGLPKPKQEAFQYLTKKLVFPKLAARKNLAGEARNSLVFVDGFYEEGLSQMQSGLVCMGLEIAVRSYGLFLQNRLALTLEAESDPLAALNGAFLGRGAFLYVPPKCNATIHLQQIYTQDGLASPRLHIYVGRGGSLTLTQESDGICPFANSFLDIVLDAGSECKLVDRAQGDFQAIRATLKRDSKLKAVLLGPNLRRSVRVGLAEENSEVEVLGLARLEHQQESHFHIFVEHIAPHTRSKTHVKSVLKDKSRVSFEGKIYVHSEAQKTEGYQLNNNLLLSDESSANAKPNLEIFADDVKASHGATTGKLDEEELFYLRSRGVGLDQAKEWLIDGFCREITDHAR